MNADGTLSIHSQRWGGMMRKSSTIPVSKIECGVYRVLADGPILKDDMNLRRVKFPFNLGEVSEDVLKDGRMSF